MRDYHLQACAPSRLRLGALLLPFLLLCSSAGASDGDGGPSLPFSSVEDVFLQGPDAASAKVNLRYITSMPHVAGTAGNHIMADFMVDQFTLLGIPNVSVFDLDVLLNYPNDNVPPKLTLFSTSTANNNNSVIYEAKLSEDILDFDNTSDTMWRNHTFHGYGASRNVTAPMAYANYGRPQDFEALVASKQSLTYISRVKRLFEYTMNLALSILVTRCDIFERKVFMGWGVWE